MPRMFAVQLKDDAAERYEDSVSTPVYTQDFEECVGWLGDELPDKGHPCEFAKPAGDGATYCAAEVDKIRYENAKLRELVRDMWHDMPKSESCGWDSEHNHCTGYGSCNGECSYWYRMNRLGIEVD